VPILVAEIVPLWRRQQMIDDAPLRLSRGWRRGPRGIST
jgi:hypothetical protein